MTKGGKRYAHMERDGNWFAHFDKEQSVKSRERCTSTGHMLAHGVPQPVTQGGDKYPKISVNSEKKIMARNYPLSEHDNRAALMDSIDTYNNGVGRKKCLDDRRQHNSHFCLCDESIVSTAEQRKKDHPTDQTYSIHSQSRESQQLTYKRRFPRSHLERSRQAAMTPAGQSSMWFGRHDLKQKIPLKVLAASNHSPSA